LLAGHVRRPLAVKADAATRRCASTQFSAATN
jgi:hypothetical protein